MFLAAIKTVNIKRFYVWYLKQKFLESSHPKWQNYRKGRNAKGHVKHYDGRES